MRLQTEPLRLQRDRPPAGERVEHGRQSLWEALRDLGAGLGEHDFVRARLPPDQALDQVEQPGALGVLRLDRGELLGP
jgi:hypothetical protein